VFLKTINPALVTKVKTLVWDSLRVLVLLELLGGVLQAFSLTWPQITLISTAFSYVLLAALILMLRFQNPPRTWGFLALVISLVWLLEIVLSLSLGAPIAWGMRIGGTIGCFLGAMVFASLANFKPLSSFLTAIFSQPCERDPAKTMDENAELHRFYLQLDLGIFAGLGVLISAMSLTQTEVFKYIANPFMSIYVACGVTGLTFVLDRVMVGLKCRSRNFPDLTWPLQSAKCLTFLQMFVQLGMVALVLFEVSRYASGFVKGADEGARIATIQNEVEDIFFRTGSYPRTLKEVAASNPLLSSDIADLEKRGLTYSINAKVGYELNFPRPDGIKGSSDDDTQNHLSFKKSLPGPYALLQARREAELKSQEDAGQNQHK